MQLVFDSFHIFISFYNIFSSNLEIGRILENTTPHLILTFVEYGIDIF